MNYIRIPVTDDMLKYAEEASKVTAVNRTIASPYDTISGLVGELVFAQLIYGDFRKHNLYDTKGRPDFFDEIEIKTSAFPFSEKLNLLVRQDYAVKRKPKFYVQVILDIENRNIRSLPSGIDGIICGYANHIDVDAAPLRDFGSKFGGKGGYRCHFIQVNKLRPIQDVIDYIKNK